MTLRLKEGAYYVDASNRIVGPMRYDQQCHCWHAEAPDRSYSESGRTLSSRDPEKDSLKHEFVGERGFHLWEGGLCPESPDTLIEYKMMVGDDQIYGPERANALRWDHDDPSRNSNIIQYRIVEGSKLAPKIDLSSQNDGFQLWEGGACPVNPSTLVEYKMADDDQIYGPALAKQINWQHRDMHRSAFVTNYRIFRNSTAKAEIDHQKKAKEDPEWGVW
jgi:hypothetical protein